MDNNRPKNKSLKFLYRDKSYFDSLCVELDESNESIDINQIEEEIAFKEDLNQINDKYNQSENNFNDNSLLFKEEEEDINDNFFLYREESKEDNIEDEKLIGNLNDLFNNNKNISNNKTSDNSFNNIDKCIIKFKCKKSMENNNNKIGEIIEEYNDFKFKYFFNHNNYTNSFIYKSFRILDLEENKEDNTIIFNNIKNSKIKKNSSSLNNI